nr:PREDICTED: tetraspanin-32 isoform X1 [Rhinolophus sinicus]
MAALTYFGAHFAVIGHASPEDTPYEAMHHWLFYAGISLAGLLTLGAVLSAIATVREAGGLMAGGFLCFALVFCVLTQMAFWRLHNPAQFLCCGKSTPSSLLGSSEADLCLGEEATRQDCLQGIRSFLRTHGHITSTLASVGLASMTTGNLWNPVTSWGGREPLPLELRVQVLLPPSQVYAMLLSSFLGFAIRSGRSLDRKGTYTLSPRARGRQPQEPSVFRRFQEELALHHLSEAGALHDRLGPSGRADSPRLLQDN